MAIAVPKQKRSEPANERPVIAGISISNATRVLDPTGKTKLELARWYETIAERMLPHVAQRPLTLVRWAEGRSTEKGGVYLRHAKAWGPKALRRVKIQEKTKVGEYLVAEDVSGLVALAQMDILEIHTWSSKIDDVEHPDRLVFDIDPSSELPWSAIADAACTMREKLSALGLESFVKTTGGKGLHVVVPLEPHDDWEACFLFTRAFALLLERSEPKRFVASVAKARRTGKIYVDYLRNNRGNTSVAAYSTRARPGAPISLPIAWEDIARDPRVRPVTIAHSRVARGPDPWGDWQSVRQRLPRISAHAR